MKSSSNFSNARGSRKSEGDQRSSISRAYYGAYHICLTSLPAEFAPPASIRFEASSHRAIVDALNKWGRSLFAGRTEARQAARKLANLRDARTWADYSLDGISEFEPVFCVEDAKRTVEMVLNARERYDTSLRQAKQSENPDK